MNKSTFGDHFCMHPFIVRLSVALFLAIAALGSAADAAAAGQMVITTDTNLTADHWGNVRFNADNITLDCQGHQIHSTGSAVVNCGTSKCGIVANGRKNITIRNCEVVGAGFRNAIWLNNTEFARIFSSQALGASQSGIRIETASNLILGSVDAGANSGEGIVFRNVGAAYVGYTWAWGNLVDGFDDGSSGTGCSNGGLGIEFAEDTRAFENGVNGFEEDCSAHNNVYYPLTLAEGNGQHGFSFDNSYQFTLVSVTARSNVADGIRFQNVDNSYVEDGTFVNNGGCDRRQNGASTGNQWVNNTWGTSCN